MILRRLNTDIIRNPAPKIPYAADLGKAVTSSPMVVAPDRLLEKSKLERIVAESDPAVAASVLTIIPEIIAVRVRIVRAGVKH